MLKIYSKAKLDFFSILSKKELLKNRLSMYWKKCFRKLKSFALKKKTPKNCKKGKKWWCFWRKKGWPCSWLKMRIWHKTWRVASSALKQYAWKNMFLKVGRKHVVFLTKLDFCTKFIEFHGIFIKRFLPCLGLEKEAFPDFHVIFFHFKQCPQ